MLIVWDVFLFTLYWKEKKINIHDINMVFNEQRMLLLIPFRCVTFILQISDTSVIRTFHASVWTNWTLCVMVFTEMGHKAAALLMHEIRKKRNAFGYTRAP